jgi:hypothetical protein
MEAPQKRNQPFCLRHTQDFRWIALLDGSVFQP